MVAYRGLSLFVQSKIFHGNVIGKHNVNQFLNIFQ